MTTDHESPLATASQVKSDPLSLAVKEVLERLHTVTIERDEARVATDFANLACERKDARIVELEVQLSAYADAVKALDGRLGIIPQSIVWACEEYVAAEDALPDCFDSDDYQFSKAVKSVVTQLTQAHKERDEAVAACAEIKSLIASLLDKGPVEAGSSFYLPCCDALSSDCAKAFLDRMKEAEWLLRDGRTYLSGDPSETMEWLVRRDKWLGVGM